MLHEFGPPIGGNAMHDMAGRKTIVSDVVHKWQCSLVPAAVAAAAAASTLTGAAPATQTLVSSMPHQLQHMLQYPH